MAVNQAEIMSALESAIHNCATEEGRSDFPYALMHAFDLPKSMITTARNGGSTNIRMTDEDVGLAGKFYFRPVKPGQSLQEEVDRLAEEGRLTAKKVRFIIATDFHSLVSYDRVADDWLEIPFKRLDKTYGFFLPLAGIKKAEDYQESSADVKAAQRLGRLFDELKRHNQVETEEQRHDLNVFLTRLLFCYFAEDTGILTKSQFTGTLDSHTHEDGSDTSDFISLAFDVMSMPDNDPRRKALPDHMAAFPYVNGGLFETSHEAPAFTGFARRELIRAGHLKWEEINPDIFGSMFQAVVGEGQRQHLGQHYTSVPNIMKTISPLFLDDMRDEYEAARGNKKRLERLLKRLHRVKVADFACGSGNFLIIAYKRLRMLEMDVLQALQDAADDKKGMSLEGITLGSTGIQLKNFFGIEIDDFAHEVAMLALWIAEHQVNQQFRERFGDVEPPLPLKSGGSIVCANALTVDWESVCSVDPGDEIYIIGNPPFLGAGKRSDEQADAMASVFAGFRKHKYLDFVACWFWKSAQYIKTVEATGGKAEAALIATNSICQGVQAATLWDPILEQEIKIRFAHQGFKWKNQAKGQAGVHVCVVGMTTAKNPRRRLFLNTPEGWQELNPVNINPYLLPGNDITVVDVSRPLVSGVQPMMYGNKPVDGGHLLLTPGEKDELLAREPAAERWIKRLIGSDELMKGKERWCLWLVDANDRDIDSMPLVRERVNKVRDNRLASRDAGARKLAEQPHLFRDVVNAKRFLAIPQVTSERRPYAPIGFFDGDTIPTNLVNIISLESEAEDSGFYEFGLLQSRMHMLWLATVAGRLKSDYRYSSKLVYNTFPWPQPTAAQREAITKMAIEAHDARDWYPTMSLGEMYDPDKMPDKLRKAHEDLDAAVEAAYRDIPFRNDSERLAYLFKRYENLVN